MCGVAGFLDVRPGRATVDALRATAQAMGDTLIHRGPDAGGVWFDASAGFGVAHRRLSVVDLSAAGTQPMLSADGRYCLSYNGEIYNSDDLRPDLVARGIVFRGHSDTEVVLEACAAWGVRAAVERLIGMFAFALWDRQDRRLTLVRDRLGIKPLYWAQTETTFLFGSELQALMVHPACPREIDQDAIALYMRHSYVPAPLSVFRGVRKLMPGQMLTVTATDATPRLETFWSLDDLLVEDAGDGFTGNDAATETQLDALLRDAVGRRMVADVPLGAFLSGGIDSSTVVAQMQAQSLRPVRTFSIGFEEDAYNEAQHAAQVAKHLGTDHTELYVTPQDARDVIPRLPGDYGEPFADSSQIPTFLVSRMTRQHVAVALSGDGGDELFGGYTRYFTALQLRRLLVQPRPLRTLEAQVIRALSPQTWDRLGRLIPVRHRPQMFGDKLHKVARLLRGDFNSLYCSLISYWDEADDVVVGGSSRHGVLWDPTVSDRVPDLVDRMQYLDTLTYLPDDILTKVDRSSMAVSLEARVPLLDHRVVAFAWTLPRHMRVRHGYGKWLLRQVLQRYIPPALVERPKMGFGVPIDSWLRGPLRDWAEDLLAPASLDRHGLLNPAPVQRRWREHLSGQRNWQYHLWAVLMLQSWCARYLT